MKEKTAARGLMVFINDERRPPRNDGAHAAISVYQDGSGNIGIYYGQRQKATIHVRHWKQWNELRQELNRLAEEMG